MAYSPAWVYIVYCIRILRSVRNFPLCALFVETNYLTADTLLRKYVTCATGCFCDINGQEGGRYIIAISHT